MNEECPQPPSAQCFIARDNGLLVVLVDRDNCCSMSSKYSMEDAASFAQERVSSKSAVSALVLRDGVLLRCFTLDVVDALRPQSFDLRSIGG